MPTTIMNNISSSNKSKEVLFKNAGGLHRHFTEQQMERIQNRPTRAAAIEFLSDSSGNTDNNIDWKLLPQRLDYLCRAIDRWVS